MRKTTSFQHIALSTMFFLSFSSSTYADGFFQPQSGFFSWFAFPQLELPDLFTSTDDEEKKECAAQTAKGNISDRDQESDRKEKEDDKRDKSSAAKSGDASISTRSRPSRWRGLLPGGIK